MQDVLFTQNFYWQRHRCTMDKSACLFGLLPDLSTRLLLLLLEEGQETDTRHLGDLETHTGNITLGVARATETSDEHLVLSKRKT